MAGTNPYGYSENPDATGTARDRRNNTTRYPGFVGGETDPTTGNVTPATSTEASGTNLRQVVSAPTPPPPAPEVSETPMADKFNQRIGGVQHSNIDPVAHYLSKQYDKALFGKRVICTELFRTGEISRELYRADMLFTQTLSPITVQGYHAWAIPAVRLMKRSPIFRRLIKIISLARAREIGYVVGIVHEPCYTGKIVRWIVEPLCFVIGLFVFHVVPTGVENER